MSRSLSKAGALVAKCLDELAAIVRPGIFTSQIDDFVRKFAFDHKAYPATLMYRGYRYSTCTSINHVVCHGIPGPKLLKDGDILNIDVTVIVDGWFGDTSRMYVAGTLARKAERLIAAADIVFYDALVGPGVLGLIPPGVERVGVGKRSGRHSKAQESINHLLLAAAKIDELTAKVTELYKKAGITNPRKQIDCAEIYVPFSWYEPMWLEGHDLVGHGEAWKLIESGDTNIGGRFPVNPSGGVLSSNPIGASGMLRFAEAALQVRGMAGEHQVDGAKVAVAQAYGASAQYFSMWVVGASLDPFG